MSQLTRGKCQQRPIAELGRRILAEVVSACRAAEATLWLLSADRTQMEAALNCGLSAPIIEASSVPVTESVVGMVACNGLPVSIGPDDYHHPEIDQRTQKKTLAMIASPLYVDGAICGALSAINPVAGGLFSAADLEQLAWKAYLLGLILNDIERR
jgi:transcriptional regulator with GAF, ATPase, and Fis domain